MLQKGDKVSLFVSVVEPRGKVCRFWGQTDTPKCQKIEALMEEAAVGLATNNTPVSLDSVEVGDVFLAKFHEDQRWYRAKVKEVDKAAQKVKVFFLDYGNEEVVGVQEMAKGHGKHFEIPPQASQYILGDMQAADNREWTETEVAGLNEQLVYGEFEGIVLNGGTVGNPPTVRLLKADKSGETVATTLIAAGFGTRSSIGMEPPLPQTILTPEQSYHVYVVFYESPLNFWIQLVERESVLNELQESIGSEITDSSESVARIALGTVCIAKFRDAESDFETYYRAVVTNILPDKRCTVLYVDYGNSETLSLNEVKVMPSRFRQLPSQAIQCCLHGSLADAADFQRMLESENIYANVASVMDSGLHVVQLSENQQTARQPVAMPEPVHAPPTKSNQAQNRLSNQNTGMRTSFKPLQFNVGKHIDLCISHVEPSGKFYCQLLENGPRLNQLMIILHERAQAGTPMNILPPGTPCLTKSVLDRDVVYRSKIVTQPEPQKVTVQHVDFGLSEDVPLSNILFIDEDLLDLPAQAIHCSLSGADDFDPEAVANVLRRYESQTALVGGVVLKSGQLYEMDLVDTSGIEDKYIVQELQRSSSENSNTPEPYNKVSLKAGQWTDVQVMFIDNPDRVFCQFVSSQEELGAMMEKVEAYCASGGAARLTRPRPGTPCLARYSEDGVWYRATVTGVQSAGVEVFFVDYGNHDLVKEENLRAMPPDFLLLPVQCFRGMLDGISPPSAWTDQDAAVLFDMAAEESHPAFIVRYDSQEDFYMVQLFTSSGVNVNEKFGQATGKLSPKYRNCGPPPHVGGRNGPTITPVSSRNGTPPGLSGPTSPTTANSQGWATWQQANAETAQIEIKPTEVEPGYKDITIETIVTPGEFYSRLNENEEILKVFMDHINNEYGGLAPDSLLLTTPAEGMICAAKFSGDWYRAKILSVTRQAIHVQYIDYGHSQTVLREEVKQLIPSHAKLPAQAVRCCLAGVAPASGTWSEESSQIFEEIVGDMSSVGAFTECGRDGTYLIEVIQTIPGGQILVHEELLKRGVAISLEPKISNAYQVLLRGSRLIRSVSNSSTSSAGSQSPQVCLKYSKPPAHAGQTVDVNVVHVETPNEFWVQLTEKCAELESLMGSLQDYYSVLRPDQCRLPSVKQDMACIARFSEDEMWYRAEVVQVQRGEVMVRYVDYGNYEKRSTADIWEMKQEFMALPAQAIQCSLHGVVAPPTGWAATTKDTVEDLVLDKNLLAEVVSLSPSQGLTVRLTELGERGQKDIADVLVGMRLAMQNTQPTPPKQFGRNTQRAMNSHAPSPPRATVHPTQAAPPVKKDMPPQDIAVGDSMKVNMVWANSPTSFYCQRVESQGVLNQMMAAINETYETMRMRDCELRDPQPGQICVAMYDADGNWYRSRVLRTRNREAEVLYVDYGNKDRLSFAKLKAIKPQFLDTPQLAIHCMLRDMEVYDGKYSVAVEQYFQALMNENLSVNVLTMTETPGGPHAVSIQDQQGIDVTSHIASLEKGPQKSVKQELRSSPRNDTRIKQEVRLPPRNDVRQVKEERSTRTPPRSDRTTAVNLKTLNTPLRPGNGMALVVSNIESIECFYCQLSSNTAGLDRFMETLESHYAAGKERPLTSSQVKSGMPCAAQFSEDNFWYRASVKRVISPSELDVLFVDYGNSEVTTLQKVCPLLAKFADYPTQAFTCSLSGVALTTNDALVLFRQLVEGKELTGKVIKNAGKSVEVELTDPATNMNINQEMLSKFAAAEKLATKDAAQSYPPVKLPSGGDVEVYVAHVDSPASFWLQVADQETEVESFATSMLYKYDSLGPEEQRLQKVVVNRPCVARYSEDQAWYRGTIEKIDGTSVTVRFIDYGNTDTVNSAELKSVVPEFLKMPPFAVHCRLAGLVEPASGWTEDQKATLEGLETTLKATFSPTGTPVPVKLSADGADVAQQIGPVVEEQQTVSLPAKYPAASIPSSSISVYASHIEDGFIYVQLVEQSDDLQNVTEKLQEIYESVSHDDMSPKDIQKGVACCAKFSEDEAWYRANIESISGKDIKVQFVDFGNSETQKGSPLKALTPDLLQHPPFAYKCQLDGLRKPDSGWPEGFNASLEEQLMDCQITANFVNSQEPYVVKMVVEEQDVSEMIQKEFTLGEVPATSQNTPENSRQSVIEPAQQAIEPSKFPDQIVPTGQTTAFVSHLEGLDSIYLQLESDSGALQEVTDRLQTVYTALGPTEMAVKSPQEGMAYCAKFSEDEAWYRAVVEGQTDQDVQVRFVDFGNTERTTCESLKQLRPDLLQCPAFAFRCQIDGLPDQGDGLMAKLEELLTDQEIQTVFVSDSPPFCVNMSVEGEDVTTSILAEKPEAAESAEEIAAITGNSEEQQPSEKISEEGTETRDPQQESLELPPSKRVAPQDKISISAIDSPSAFYVQSESELDALEEFMEQVSTACEDPSPLENLRPGQLCCAKYSEDGAWYRALITKVDEKITVRFVDYGNYDTIEADSILPLPASLAGHPAFASTYQLMGASTNSWTEEQIEQFTDLTMHKDLVVKEVQLELSPPGLRLTEGDIDINDTMRINESVQASPEIEVQSSPECSIQPSPESEEEFLEVAEEVSASGEQEQATSTTPTEQAVPGGQDQSSEASEEFTDAIDEVNQAELLLKPGTRVEVEVQHIKSPSQFWCRLVRCREEREGVLESVQEFCDSATAPEDIEMGKIYGARYIDGEWCRVSIRDVGDEQVSAFYIDYGTTEKVYKTDLRLLPLSLVKAPAFALPFLLSGVKPVESKWSEKAKMYFEELVLEKTLLAEVIAVEETVYVVQLLDMGIEVSKKLIQMNHAEEYDIAGYKEEEEAQPEKTPSELQSPEKGEDYTYRDLDQAKSTLFFGADDDDDETSDTESDICELPESTLKRGERLEVLISHVKTFESIFVQLKTKQAFIESQLDELQEAYESNAGDASQEFQSTIKPGILCAALSADDQLWYRAIVLEASDGDATVQFVDYGNTETLESEQLRPLKPKFSAEPKQAIKCSLHGAEDVSEDVFETFVVEVQDRTLLAEVVDVGEDDVPSLKLLDMGSCVLSRLITNLDKEPSEQQVVNPEEESENEITEPNCSKEKDDSGIEEHVEKTDNEASPVCEPQLKADINGEDLTIAGNKNNNAICDEDETEYIPENAEIKELSESQQGEDIKENNNIPSIVIENVLDNPEECGTDEVKTGETDPAEGPTSEKMVDQDSESIEVLPSVVTCNETAALNEDKEPEEKEIGEVDNAKTEDSEVCAALPEDDMADSECQTAAVQENRTEENMAEGRTVEESSEQAEVVESSTKTPEDPLTEDKEDSYAESGAIGESTTEERLTEDSDEETCIQESQPEDADAKCDSEEVSEKSEGDTERKTRIEDPQGDKDVEIPQAESISSPEESAGGKSQEENEQSQVDTDVSSIEEEETGNREVEGVTSEDVFDSTPISDIDDLKEQVVECVMTSEQSVNPVDGGKTELMNDDEPGEVSVEVSSVEMTPDLDEEESTKSDELEPLHFRYPCLCEGDELSVTTSVTNSPQDFWCQLINPSTTDLPLLIDQIQDNCSGEASPDTALNNPTIDTPCFSRCSLDGNWYRGKVINISGDSAEVRYVDYGNSESATISDLRRLSPEFLELNAQAFRCRLQGVASNDGGPWDETSCARFEELVTDKDLLLTIKSKKRSGTDETLTVTLQEEDASIAAVLIEGGYAQTDVCGSPEGEERDSQSHEFAPTPLEAESVVDVVYLGGVSPDNFILQLQDGAEELKTVLLNLPTVEATADDMVVKVGQAVLVESRRGVVRRVVDGQCTVELVDDGLTETVPVASVRPLPEAARDPLPLALHCQLAGIEAEAWTDEALACFKDLSSSRTLSARVAAVEGLVHHVYLYDRSDPSGQSVNSLLVSKGHAWMAADTELDLDCSNEELLADHQDHLESSFLEVNRERRQSLGALGDTDESDSEQDEDENEVLTYSSQKLTVGEVIDVLCLSAKDPESLVCRLTSDGAEYEAMETALNDTYHTGEGESVDATHLHSGHACLAYSAVAGSWRRARVLTKEGSSLGVHYVDVGDGETVPLTDVRPITPTWLRLPAQAVTCRLAGVTPVTDQWTHGAGTALSELVVGKVLAVTVREIGVDEQPVVTVTGSDGEDVTTALVQAGLAEREETRTAPKEGPREEPGTASEDTQDDSQGEETETADLQEDRTEETSTKTVEAENSDGSTDDSDGAKTAAT